ncbi:MAG: glycosyltransferase family 2 protein [Candidatus Lokiarchaeota archaeon]|nr:glycosyltransferase family 2 protein [Candidatus Lokiarchaeota archaeon]
MKDKYRISVVIPTYNEEANIKETLISVKNQRCSVPYEIIVVDGHSSDETVSIAKNYAKTYISPKKGKANQLNYIVPETSGDLLVFLDADTIIEPNFLQKIYKIFQRHKNLFACSARVKYYNDKSISFKLGSQRFTITMYFFLNLGMHIYYFCKSLLGFPELMGCNIIVRRDIFFKARGFRQLPSNLLGIDKVFSDSLIYLKRKVKRGKIKTLNFVYVFTSGRTLNARRSLRRIKDYHSKKDIYYNSAKGKN